MPAASLPYSAAITCPISGSDGHGRKWSIGSAHSPGRAEVSSVPQFDPFRSECYRLLANQVAEASATWSVDDYLQYPDRKQLGSHFAGLFSQGGPITISNSTISGNTATCHQRRYRYSKATVETLCVSSAAPLAEIPVEAVATSKIEATEATAVWKLRTARLPPVGKQCEACNTFGTPTGQRRNSTVATTVTLRNTIVAGNTPANLAVIQANVA